MLLDVKEGGRGRRLLLLYIICDRQNLTISLAKLMCQF